MKLLAFLLASGKLGKVFATVGSMALSVLMYAWVYGWRYAVGFVALLFCHELGHFWAAKRRGMDVGAPTFIPFVGAWINLKDQPRDAETEAYVGFAGPFIGTLAAVACYFLARAYDSSLLLAVAYSGLFLNLFNLIPLSPLDGGRITSVLTPRVWLLGVPVLAALFLYRPSPMLVAIALLAAPNVVQAWRFDPKAPENAAYYGVSAEARLTYGAYYLGLTAFLAIMTGEVHDMLGAVRGAI